MILWLLLAWANGRGYDWGRGIFMAFFWLTTASLLFVLHEGGAVYAPAELIATTVLWLTELAAVVLICTRASNRYYRHEPARR